MKKLFLLIPALVLALVTNAQTIPSTDFADPGYYCAADDAVLTGEISSSFKLEDSADPHYIKWYDRALANPAVASWTINSTRACYISVSLELGPEVGSNKHNFEVRVFDAENNELGMVTEGGENTASEQVKALAGKILIPAAGNITIELINNRDWGKGSIKNVILAYVADAPVTDFAAPGYSCAADDAVLTGEISSSFKLEDSADPHFIKWNDRALANPAAASWTVISTRACYIAASLDLGIIVGSNKHNFEVRVFDAENNELGMVTEGGENTASEQVKALAGKILIPAAGIYTVELVNNRDFGKGSIKNVVLTYAGAAPITDFAAPGYYCTADDAVLTGEISASFKFEDSADPHYIKWSDRGLANPAEASWNIMATRSGYISVALDLGVVVGSNKHNFEVRVFDANNTELGMVTEGGENTASEQVKTLEGNILIPAAGNYTIQLVNNRDFGKGSIKNVILTYAGGNLVNLPSVANTPVVLPFEDVALSSLAFINTDDQIQFTDETEDNGSKVSAQYAKWRMHAAKEGCYKFATHVKSANGQSYTVTIYNSNETVVKGTKSLPESGNWGYERTFTTDNIYLEEGDYILKVQNNTNYSKGRLYDITATYERGARQNVPGQILGEDAMICKEESSTHDVKMYHLENGDLQYNDNGHNLEEYALWNIHADAACELSVTLNIAHSGHMFTVELYDGETLLGTAIEADATKWDDGNIELEDHLNIPAAGNYTIKLINRQQYSGGALHGITFTEIVPPTVVVLDEMAEDNNAWISYKDGDAVNVQLTRTIVAGMYNTICLPFDVDGTQTQAIFGSDVQLFTLGTTALEDDVLTLNVDAASDIYHGTPYLIKTSADVVNPQFEGVQILSEVPANTSSTYVDFIGNFIKSEVPAGENNLFLGPNDLLYFSQNATPIKGMRAYFRVKGAAAAAAKRARIVTKENTATAIDLVNGEKKALKCIDNGQVIIIRDGIRYNVMGTKLQ